MMLVVLRLVVLVVLKLKPAKPAKGCNSEGEGERVSVGEVVADVVMDATTVLVLVRGEWD